jgi:hypothetical protein
VLIRDAKPTPHCFAFLRWATEFHRPYWVTTRDTTASTQESCAPSATPLAPPNCPLKSMLCSGRSDRPSGRSKTSGIDLASDFIWIDEDPLGVEIEALRGRGLLNRLIVIDTDYSLVRVIDVIKSLP